VAEEPGAKKKESRLRWWTIIIPLSTVRFWITFAFVLMILSGLFAAAWYQYLGPRGRSRALIAEAEKTFDQAIVLGVKELAFEQYRNAQNDLFEAKKNYDERKWVAARLLAEEALSLLGKAMEGLQSEKYFVRERKASVTFAGGTVEVQRTGSLAWESARAGIDLRKGDRVRTRSGGSIEIVFDDGSHLTIKSDSLVLIDELSEDVRTREKSSAIRLLESDVEANILRPTARGSRFLIETPNATAQVNRARMDVRVRKDRQTEFTLQSGDVTVRSGDREIALGDNDNLAVTAPGQTVRGKVAPAPALRDPPNLAWMVSREPAVAVSLSWAAVPDARGYRVSVAGDRFFSNPAFAPVLAESPGYRISALPPGLYFWRVATVDRQGREGIASPFRAFRVLRDVKPPALEFSDPIVLREKGVLRVLLTGAAEPGTRVTLDGRPVPLAQDGSFSTFMPIAAVPGSLRVWAVDPAGNTLATALEVR
jgi:hypothetical protein